MRATTGVTRTQNQPMVAVIDWALVPRLYPYCTQTSTSRLHSVMTCPAYVQTSRLLGVMTAQPMSKPVGCPV
jgi:hypothetical protein